MGGGEWHENSGHLAAGSPLAAADFQEDGLALFPARIWSLNEWRMSILEETSERSKQLSTDPYIQPGEVTPDCQPSLTLPR